ncbi:MAG: Re/Si-specific NAD(P)(+) transhydrogenase subunit alpha [Sulfuritalea sp.]|nr:Re/Si-specific NAD(P)(+) transhydrogenase subunit alpha [Sulfuritalea sp.]
MALRIGVPRETLPGEKRVATVPEVVEKLIKLGFAVAVESGAGDAANCSDDTYRTAGAEIIQGAAQLWAASDIVFKVGVPTAEEVGLLREGGTLIGFVWPAQNPELMQQLAVKKATVLAIDALPRTLSRAQKMDALTSQAGVAGYRAVIEAANAFGRFFNGQITAAGKVPPAKVFIAGAGVAGLAAIGTAAGLGAIVRANDTRAEVADQVVSLGGEFVKVDFEEEGSGGGGYAKVMSEGFQQAQREMYAKQAREVDIIITTALIPGKPAPRLITAEMVQSMKPGSVIVDMAAERGGNCELTEPGQSVVKHGVTIVGYTDLTSRLAKQSSTLYGTNLFRLAEELVKTKSVKDDGTLDVNMEDEAIRGLTVVKEGSITWPPPPPKQVAAPPAKPAAAAVPQAKKGHGHGAASEPMAAGKLAIMFAVASVLFWFVGANAPAAFLAHFTVFVLACFVGYMVVWNVTPALHTPLMSVTNAISSIICIGALVQIAPPLAGGAPPDQWIRWLAVGGIALTAVNMFGGFAVTQRMLDMFRK